MQHGAETRELALATPLRPALLRPAPRPRECFLLRVLDSTSVSFFGLNRFYYVRASEYSLRAVVLVILGVEIKGRAVAELLRAALPPTPLLLDPDLLVTPRPKPPCMVTPAVCPDFGFDWLSSKLCAEDRSMAPCGKL